MTEDEVLAAITTTVAEGDRTGMLVTWHLRRLGELLGIDPAKVATAIRKARGR